MHIRTSARRAITGTVLALVVVAGGTVAWSAIPQPDQCSGTSGEAQQDCRLDRLEASVYGTPSPSDTPTPTDTSTPTPTDTPTPTPSPDSPAVLGASLGQPLPDPGTLPAVRIYSPGTTWGGKFADQYANGTRTFVISSKSSDATAFKRFLQTMPGDATAYVTYYHEPDDNIADGSLTPAAWCNGLDALGRAVAGMPNVEVGPIHNGFIGQVTWTKDEAPCDKSLWTYWGADRYSPKYEPPSTQFAEVSDYAKSLSLPLVLGEVGASPSNANAQETLAGQIHTWALDPANNAAVVCWWQQTGYVFANADVQHAFLGN